VLINAANRTVLVTVPLSTSRTGTLTPVISHNGAAVSPASGAGQSFFSAAAYTPVEYTVTAADGSAAVWTVMVRLDSSSLNSVSAVSTYLSSNTAPVFLPVSLNLADTGGNSWADLLGAIQTANKNVALDLSACTMTGMTATAGEFDPGTANTGESKIVSLVLPDTAASIKAGTSSAPTFRYFGALKSIAAAGVTGVGGYAFFGCTALTSVSLPAATSISGSAFEGCTGLTTVSLPAATSIGNYAFGDTGGTPLTLTLGVTAPTLGANMFYDVTADKAVTVKVPSGATGYGTVPVNTTDNNWGNAFRGRGWDGSAYGTGIVNGNIKLTVEYLP
jgi:hypothetical protein